MKTIVPRAFAVLLIVGGVFGIGISAIFAISMAKQGIFIAVMMLLYGAVFAYAGHVGIRLWNFRPGSRQKALIVFATQIPIFGFPGMAYEWYTGLCLKIMGGTVEQAFGLELGSSMNLIVGSETSAPYYGLNLVAMLAVYALYLYPDRFPGQVTNHYESEC